AFPSARAGPDRGLHDARRDRAGAAPPLPACEELAPPREVERESDPRDPGGDPEGDRHPEVDRAGRGREHGGEQRRAAGEGERNPPPGAPDRLLEVAAAAQLDLESAARSRARDPLEPLDHPGDAQLQLLGLVDPALKVEGPTDSLAD